MLARVGADAKTFRRCRPSSVDRLDWVTILQPAVSPELGGAMITLTPLTGPPASSSTAPLADQPVCHLLQVDDVKILLDLGGYDPRHGPDRSFQYEEKIRE